MYIYYMTTSLCYINESNNKYKKLIVSKLCIEIISCYDITKQNRFWIQIYFSDNINKKNIFIILQNPSNKNNTFTKIVNYFCKFDLYSLTIINLFPIIESNITKYNYYKILDNPYNILNIDIIKNKFYQENPIKCIFGCGQHLIKYISQCMGETIKYYMIILDIIKNLNIEIYHFGALVVNNTLPRHPSRMLLNITKYDINVLYNNLKKI